MVVEQTFAVLDCLAPLMSAASSDRCTAEDSKLESTSAGETVMVEAHVH